MSETSYEAIVIGGGHHGTIIACYLQNAGLKTVIFERQHELGGGAWGEELPLPGFIQNTCARCVRRNAGLLLQPYRRFRVFRPLRAQGVEANPEPDSVGVLRSTAGHSYHQKSTANWAGQWPRLDECISQITSPYVRVGQTKNAKEDIELDSPQIFGYSKNIMHAFSQ
jgi:cation diffusion facilitator CzcD-associated flavoprotein CzcO